MQSAGEVRPSPISHLVLALVLASTAQASAARKPTTGVVRHPVGIGCVFGPSRVKVEAMGFRPLPPEELLPVARKLLSLNIRLDERSAA